MVNHPNRSAANYRFICFFQITTDALACAATAEEARAKALAGTAAPLPDDSFLTVVDCGQEGRKIWQQRLTLGAVRSRHPVVFEGDGYRRDPRTHLPLKAEGLGMGDRPERYRKHQPVAGPRQMVDGADLGPSMLPQDVLIWLRLLAYDDDEILQAMQLGADELEADRPEPPLPELSAADREMALHQARRATRSRLDAWRRRHRQMTWLELRVLLLGLRALNARA